VIKSAYDKLPQAFRRVDDFFAAPQSGEPVRDEQQSPPMAESERSLNEFAFEGYNGGEDGEEEEEENEDWEEDEGENEL
jgi:hypothetical protein